MLAFGQLILCLLFHKAWAVFIRHLRFHIKVGSPLMITCVRIFLINLASLSCVRIFNLKVKVGSPLIITCVIIMQIYSRIHFTRVTLAAVKSLLLIDNFPYVRPTHRHFSFILQNGRMFNISVKFVGFNKL